MTEMCVICGQEQETILMPILHIVCSECVRTHKESEQLDFEFELLHSDESGPMAWKEDERMR